MCGYMVRKIKDCIRSIAGEQSINNATKIKCFTSFHIMKTDSLITMLDFGMETEIINEAEQGASARHTKFCIHYLSQYL